jgi:hypothetical protein
MVKWLTLQDGPMSTMAGWARPHRLEACEAVRAPAGGRRDPLNQSGALSAVPAAAVGVHAACHESSDCGTASISAR